MGKLSLAEKTFASIDDHHYYCEDMSWGYVKTAISLSAKKLLQMRKLENEEDIYFLCFDEIEALLRNELKNVDIRQRRRIYEDQTKMIPPQPLFDVKKEHSSENIIEDNTHSRIHEAGQGIILKGMPSLHKTVRGKIQKGFGKPEEIEDGSILVVHNGHGGDLFSVMGKLAGLIVTGGSPFDHMGIITRAMNIPALYYVDHAFEILKNGDMVILNGEEGTVVVADGTE